MLITTVIRRLMKAHKTYEEEAQKLARAIDIAIEAFEKYRPLHFTEEHITWTISCYQQFKQDALHPKPQFKKLSSLKYIVSDAFTYFQESAGETVEYFWKRIGEENLDYQRENRLEKILDRGKIKGRIEYDFIIDSLVPAQQSGTINEKQAALLNSMIASYKQRKRRTT